MRGNACQPFTEPIGEPETSAFCVMMNRMMDGIIVRNAPAKIH